MLNELSKKGKLPQSFQPLLKRCEKYGGVCLSNSFPPFGFFSPNIKATQKVEFYLKLEKLSNLTFLTNVFNPFLKMVRNALLIVLSTSDFFNIRLRVDPKWIIHLKWKNEFKISFQNLI